MKNKRILCISPHADDSEIGCGASISRFLEEENEVYCASFTFASQSIPDGLPKDITEKEFYKSMNTMGIDNTIVFKYPVRHFPSHRQDILEDLVKINKDIKPDLIFIPSSYDIHQDHNTIFNEAIRAFKNSCILGYEMVGNNMAFKTGFFITVNPRHIKTKIKAIKCYESQAIRNNNFEPDSLIYLAKLRGYQIRSPYAECFESIRYIMK